MLGRDGKVIDMDDAVALLHGRPQRLVAIDGLPVSGKSTLADRLAHELGAAIVYLDDFVRPEAEWRGNNAVWDQQLGLLGPPQKTSPIYRQWERLKRHLQRGRF